MKRSISRIIPILLIMLLWIGCLAEAETSGSYTQIDQKTAKEMMSRDDGHVIVDVRRQDEYDSGHIPGAILIPNESIGDHSPEALPDYDQIILIYCRSGNRSKQAAKKLADMGYTSIYEFGGINTWSGDIVTTADENASGETVSKTAELSFSSFDGGGFEYTVMVEDPSILSFSTKRDYGEDHDELECGSPYEVIFTFTGLKPGTTTVTVNGRSPIIEFIDDAIYTAVVDDALYVTLLSVRQIADFHLYRNGEIYYDSYHISHWEDGYHVSVNDKADQHIDTASVDALMQVIDEFDLSQWDGFDKTNEYVLDGEGFWLEIRLTDGTSIEARGENAFPENYFPAISAIQEILDKAEIRERFSD